MFFQQDSYLKKPPQSEPAKMAQVIDLGLTLLLIWLLTIMFYKTIRPQSGWIEVIVILIVEACVFAKYKLYQRKRIKRHRDIWYSASKYRDQLQSFDDQTEFVAAMKTLLAATGVFQKLDLAPSSSDFRGIDLCGSIRAKKVGVLCFHSKTENEILSKKTVENFLRGLRQAGCSKGIVLSNGCFTPETRRFIGRKAGKTAIRLLDGEALVKIAGRVGKPIFPNEKWHHEHDLVTGQELALWVGNNIMSSMAKAVTFIALGTIFLIVSSLIHGLNGVFYFVFGIIDLFIGFFSLFLYYRQQKDVF